MKFKRTQSLLSFATGNDDIAVKKQGKYRLALFKKYKLSFVGIIGIAMIITLIYSSSKRIYDDVININDIITKLNTKCTIHKTQIYESCYSYNYTRVLYTKYTVNKQSKRGNIKDTPEYYSDTNVNNNTVYMSELYDNKIFRYGQLAYHAAYDYDSAALKCVYNLDLNIVPMHPEVIKQRKEVENYILELAKSNDVVVYDIMTPSIRYLGSDLNIPDYLLKIIQYYKDTKLNTECYLFNNIVWEMNEKSYRYNCSRIHRYSDDYMDE